MEKYVYDFTKTLTKKDLIEELRNINYINPKKEEILKTYNVDMTNVDIDDVEATIRVNNFGKNIKVAFSLFDFTILDTNDVGDEIEKKKIRLLNLLKFNGINLETCDVYELGRVVTAIKENDNIISKLDKSYVDFKLIEEVLKKINISASKNVINDVLLLINSTTYQQAVYLPVIRSKYYDEFDSILYKIKLDIPEHNNTKLRKFSGEIYESLNFSTDEEAREYEKEQHITEELDSEIKTYIHFKGEEENDNWHKEMHILKQRNSIVVKYGDNYTFTNENNKSITSNELNKIMEFLKNKTPNNEFLKYVLKELKSLKKTLGQKTYIRKDIPIDIDSLKRISSIIADDDYGEDRNIYFKSKIISSAPLNFTNDKIKSLKK